MVASELVEQVRTTLAAQGSAPTPARVAAALRAGGGVFGDSTVLAVVESLRRESSGAGPLDELLAEPGVTDVLVNGPDQVYVDRGAGLQRVAVRIGDDATLRRLATRLASACGRRLDDATPFVDARLTDGTRFHAVLAPVAGPGTCLSFRVPPHRTFSLDDLVAAGSLPPGGAAVLRDLVDARLAFLISGGTGSGKTTLLSTMLSLVADHERLLLVEDAGELRPEHPHVVRLEARPANVEGSGEITLRALVRQALRMRPDRLVVGEVRGAEVVDLLAAMNTGHEGGCGTVHANSAADVPARLEALGIAAGLGREAVHSQVASAVHAIIHLTRGPDGIRRVAEVRVVERGPDGLVGTVPALLMRLDGSVRADDGAERLSRLLAGAA